MITTPLRTFPAELDNFFQPQRLRSSSESRAIFIESVNQTFLKSQHFFQAWFRPAGDSLQQFDLHYPSI